MAKLTNPMAGIPVRSPILRLKWHLAPSAYLGKFFEDPPSFRSLLKARRRHRRLLREDVARKRASCTITQGGSGTIVDIRFDDGRSLQALVEPPREMDPRMKQAIDGFVPSRVYGKP